MLSDKFREGWPRETWLFLECLGWLILASIGAVTIAGWFGMDTKADYCTGLWVPTKQVTQCVLSIFGSDATFAAALLVLLGLLFSSGTAMAMQRRTAWIFAGIVGGCIFLFVYWVLWGDGVPLGVQIAINLATVTMVGLTVIVMAIFVVLFGVPGMLS